MRGLSDQSKQSSAAIDKTRINIDSARLGYADKRGSAYTNDLPQIGGASIDLRTNS